MGARKISPNANALRFGLQSDIPEVYAAAKDAITNAWKDSDTVAECAAKLKVHRNTMLKLLDELGLYEEKFGT